MKPHPAIGHLVGGGVASTPWVCIVQTREQLDQRQAIGRRTADKVPTGGARGRADRRL